jgi:hypothetical protein
MLLPTLVHCHSFKQAGMEILLVEYDPRDVYLSKERRWKYRGR